MTRRLLPWLGPAAAAAALAPFVRSEGGDTWMFVRAGRTLLSPAWGRAFADRSIQVGPLQLALYGSVGRSPAALAMVLAAAAALLVMAAARTAGAGRPRIVVLAGAAAVATGLTTHVFDAGHPADGLLPLVWILAAADARRGRATRAAVLVGLSAGLETWGILGVAALMVAPGARSAGRAVLVAAGTASLLYLPFVAAGHFAMGGYRWEVAGQSLLGHLVAPGTAFGWPLRLAQGAVAILAGTLVARAARSSVHVVWLVPIAVVLVRLALDPRDHGYYFDGVQSVALVGLAFVAARGLRLPRVVREPVA